MVAVLAVLPWVGYNFYDITAVLESKYSGICWISKSNARGMGMGVVGGWDGMVMWFVVMGWGQESVGWDGKNHEDGGHGTDFSLQCHSIHARHTALANTRAGHSVQQTNELNNTPAPSCCIITLRFFRHCLADRCYIAIYDEDRSHV